MRFECVLRNCPVTSILDSPVQQLSVISYTGLNVSLKNCPVDKFTFTSATTKGDDLTQGQGMNVFSENCLFASILDGDRFQARKESGQVKVISTFIYPS